MLKISAKSEQLSPLGLKGLALILVLQCVTAYSNPLTIVHCSFMLICKIYIINGKSPNHGSGCVLPNLHYLMVCNTRRIKPIVKRIGLCSPKLNLNYTDRCSTYTIFKSTK